MEFKNIGFGYSVIRKPENLFRKAEVPHPGMYDREFVLYPLQNIEQTLEIPGHGKLAQCVQKCSKNGLQYLGLIEGVE